MPRNQLRNAREVVKSFCREREFPTTKLASGARTGKSSDTCTRSAPRFAAPPGRLAASGRRVDRSDRTVGVMAQKEGYCCCCTNPAVNIFFESGVEWNHDSSTAAWSRSRTDKTRFIRAITSFAEEMAGPLFIQDPDRFTDNLHDFNGRHLGCVKRAAARILARRRAAPFSSRSRAVSPVPTDRPLMLAAIPSTLSMSCRPGAAFCIAAHRTTAGNGLRALDPSPQPDQVVDPGVCQPAICSTFNSPGVGYVCH